MTKEAVFAAKRNLERNIKQNSPLYRVVNGKLEKRFHKPNPVLVDLVVKSENGQNKVSILWSSSKSWADCEKVGKSGLILCYKVVGLLISREIVDVPS